MLVLTSRRSRAGTALAGAVAAVVLGAAAPAAARAGGSTDSVLAWYDVTASAIAAGGAPTQVTNSRTWAIGWLAAARAQAGSRSPDGQRAAPPRTGSSPSGPATASTRRR